ncbi:MAG: HWE histidine kinase domain-containing protein [Rhodospirillaceae bacterium]
MNSELLRHKVDLTNCDREPIHILGAVQPFGFLVAVNAEWTVTRASENLPAFMGRPLSAVLNTSLEGLFSTQAIHAIRNRVTLLRGADAVERIFALQLAEESALFDVAVHFSGSALVIEAEPHQGEMLDAANQVRTLMARLSQMDTIPAFYREAARQVRVLTGFDRVMIYRFDHTGSGEVIAEALRPGVDSFLGLNYPASDIPTQARALYLRNLFRIIADVKSTPVPVIAAGDGQALDQSLSVLRSVSPIHIEYLCNMGVDASLSISIVVEGRLWGLFACHHYKPLLPSFSQRSAAELYGQMFSLMLESRERREANEFEGRARSSVDRMMAAIGQEHDLLSKPQWLGDAVMDIIPADGVGVVVEGNVAMAGLTPNKEQFAEIVVALNEAANGEVFAIDHIGGMVPGAERYAHVAAGLLAIPYSRSPRDYVVLFRSERLRTVRWAGNPEKPVEYGPHGARLTPRKSFEEWSEMVKGKATPFTSSELRVARTIHTALFEVLLRLSEDLDQERRRAYEQQQLLIAELNHRVRNILALIRGLVSQSNREHTSTGEFIRTLDSRIQSLARAHDQITARRYGPGPLRELIELEVSAYVSLQRDRVAISGENYLLSPNVYTLLALVFHELMTNAAKYGALSDNGKVTVSWSLNNDGSLNILWKESGGPVVTAPSRRGFGTTIIERSIPFELHGTAEVRYLMTGVEAEFCIPKRFLAGTAAVADAKRDGGAVRVPKSILAGKRVLLVEDSMLISLEAEDTLRDLGASEVIVAASQAAAFKALEAHAVDFAVLDFNLTNETSLPIGEKLLATGCPFIMATGYGEGTTFGEALREIPVVSKPYDANTLGAKVAEALSAKT